MSTLTTAESDLRKRGVGHFIPGTLIVGMTGSGRSTLLRQTVINEFTTDERAALIYVGEERKAAQLCAGLPTERLSGQHTALVDTVKHGGARVRGFDPNDGPSRALASRMVRTAFYLIKTRRETTPFILALDGFECVDARGYELLREELSEAFEFSSVRPVVGVQSFNEVNRMFGGAGLELFTRFERVCILRNVGDAYSDILTAQSGYVPGELPNGRAIVLTQGYDDTSSPSFVTHKLVDVSLDDN